MPHCVAARARIHYEVDGEGEPLVLVAGTAFDLSFWDDLLPELRGFRVLRLDNRGAGLSDAPDEAFSIEQMADDVAAVMDAAGMPSAHVYGASMGGLIAQELAIRYPERVLSLVLGATWAGGPPLSRAVRLLPLLLSRKGPEDLVRATAPFLSATPIPETDGRFPGHARAPRNKRALRRQLAAQLRYSSLRRLHTIRQPTLVMHGEKDRFISPLNARRMTRRIPGARLRLIAGAGHMYLDDLLRIRDPGHDVPDIAADARRRRLTTLVNAAYLGRSTPAVYVVEDAHWIDPTSESMLADFLSVVARTHSLVLVTYRPEYRGALSHVPGAQTIFLAPLDDSQTMIARRRVVGLTPIRCRIGFADRRPCGRQSFLRRVHRA